MKLKLNQNLTINGVNNLKGSIVEVEEKDAKSILSREWATEVKEPKKASAVEPEKVKEEPKAEEKKAEEPKKATAATKATAPKKEASAKTAKKTETKKA